MQVSLNSILTLAQYVKVKSNIKSVLATRFHTSSASVSLTKTSATSFRVVADGKVKCHINVNSSKFEESASRVNGVIEIMLLGTSTPQHLKISAPVLPTVKAESKTSVRTGWSFTVLVGMVVGLTTVLNVAKAFV